MHPLGLRLAVTALHALYLGFNLFEMKAHVIVHQAFKLIIFRPFRQLGILHDRGLSSCIFFQSVHLHRVGNFDSSQVRLLSWRHYALGHLEHRAVRFRSQKCIDIGSRAEISQTVPGALGPPAALFRYRTVSGMYVAIPCFSLLQEVTRLTYCAIFLFFNHLEQF